MISALISPIILTTAAGGEITASGIALRYGTSSAIDTTLSDVSYADINLSDMALPDAAAENNATHEGNGAFTVTYAGTYDYVWNGAIFSTAIGGTNTVDVTYGIWNGSSFDEVTAAKVTLSLGLRTTAVDNNATHQQIVFSDISLTAGQRIGLMVIRTAGSQNIRCRSVSCGIYKTG